MASATNRTAAAPESREGTAEVGHLLLALTDEADLFHTPEREPYAVTPVSGHREVHTGPSWSATTAPALPKMREGIDPPAPPRDTATHARDPGGMDEGIWSGRLSAWSPCWESHR